MRGGVGHAFRVVSVYLDAGGLQMWNDLEAGGIADIVRAGLEGHAEHGDLHVRLGAIEDAEDLFGEPHLATVVCTDRRANKAGLGAKAARGRQQGARVLREARAAKTGTGLEKPVADTPVHTHQRRHMIDIGIGGLADVGDLVDEGDLHGEEGVGRVFAELGVFGRREGEPAASLHQVAV